MVIKLESDRDTQNLLTIHTIIPFNMYISIYLIIFISLSAHCICKYAQIDMYLSDPSCLQNFNLKLNGSHQQLRHAAHLIVLTILSGNHGDSSFSIQ